MNEPLADLATKAADPLVAPGMKAAKLGMELFPQEITAAGGAVLIFNFMRARRIFKISPEGERV